MNHPLKVLIVDDTLLYRKLIADALVSVKDISVVGMAQDGKMGLQMIADLQPDVMTLDVEMPVMNGLQVLDELKRINSPVGTIMVSSATTRGSELTMKALEKGAFHFITKPSGGNYDLNLESLRANLIPLLRVYVQRKQLKSLEGRLVPTSEPSPSVTAPPCKPSVWPKKSAGDFRPQLLLIGISIGGPNALAEMLPKIPANLGIPILIVQHMPEHFTRLLAARLDECCEIQVKEAEHGEEIKPNVAYLAPGGKQMRLIGRAGSRLIEITDDPPENNYKPAVDYLFRSVSANFPGCSLAVIMTGMGADGTEGLKLLRKSCSYVIAQDQASCVVFGMPKTAIEAGMVDAVVSLNEIAPQIIKVVQGKS
ncbi:MAG: chemotaxis response regulator protein-glutamate methylesterase [Deltaproteobacteria bacterium]|nr:chemotaxis response regulator protein-glutamate methylesterase [Deltaproteobacteria bacterium]